MDRTVTSSATPAFVPLFALLFAGPCVVLAPASSARAEATWTLQPTGYSVEVGEGPGSGPFTPDVNYNDPAEGYDRFVYQGMFGSEIGGQTQYLPETDGDQTFLNLLGWYNSSNVPASSSATWRFAGSWDPRIDGEAEVYMGVNFAYFTEARWAEGIDRVDVTVTHATEGGEQMTKTYDQPGIGTETLLQLDSSRPGVVFDFAIEVTVHGLAPTALDEQTAFGVYIGSGPGLTVPSPAGIALFVVSTACRRRRRRD